MTYLLQSGILYGPIHSRRFGRSLGINLSPTDRKMCSLNCVYCHYGSTEELAADMMNKSDDLPSADTVLDVVESALQTVNGLDVITFSGNGEPTLHPEFPAIARGVAELVDHHRPALRTVLLSNSTGLTNPDIRDAMKYIDIPVMKLDAGTHDTFVAINRPARGVQFDEIVHQLAKLTDFTLQTLLITGDPDNTTDTELDAYLDLVEWIAPNEVQLYSTDRPVAKSGIGKVPPSKLREIAGMATLRTGVPFRVFAA
jgi:wyosine [tRNA(Phe)-imidazoG37] synthetase (radical SAM superfamily)